MYTGIILGISGVFQEGRERWDLGWARGSCIREEGGNMGFQGPLCLSQAAKKCAPPPTEGLRFPWEEEGEELGGGV